MIVLKSILNLGPDYHNHRELIHAVKMRSFKDVTALETLTFTLFVRPWEYRSSISSGAKPVNFLENDGPQIKILSQFNLQLRC